MKEEHKHILESGLLEEYIAGLLAPAQKAEVEQAINDSPDLQAEYTRMQLAIEAFAESLAVRPPSGMKRRIFKGLIGGTKPVKSLLPNWVAVAASILAVAFLGTSFLFLNRNNRLQNENGLLELSFAQLSSDYDQQLGQITAIASSLGFLKDPNTGKFVLTGNQLAPDLQTVAYWNPVREQSFLDILNLPDLPEDQCFQLWADVEGEMVSLGVIEDSADDLILLPFKISATSLNITIEPAGGSAHPHVEQLVASKNI